LRGPLLFVFRFGTGVLSLSLRGSFRAVLLIAMSVLMLTDGSGAGGGAALERREDERYPVDGDAEVTVLSGGSGAVLLRGRIKNVSQSGCYVETSALRRLAPGTPVDLLFVVRGWLVSAKADSRFSRSKIGMGFRFVTMDQDNRAKLDRFVATVRVRGEDLVLRREPASGNDVVRSKRSEQAEADGVASAALGPSQEKEKLGGPGVNSSRPRNWMEGVRRRR